MKRVTIIVAFTVAFFSFFSCKKKTVTDPVIVPPSKLILQSILLNSLNWNTVTYNTGLQPVIKVRFNQPVDPSTVAASVKLATASGTSAAVSVLYESSDSVMVVQPAAPLTPLTQYNFSITSSLKSKAGTEFITPVENSFITRIDSTRKFTTVSDEELLTLVQKQTFKYFWDFGHPVSGLARERSNGDNEVVTTGGSGFGIMAIPVAVSRNFITRAEGLARLQKIVTFLKTKPPRFHGAFSHWLNGTSGAVVPFGSNDNGADIVETSYLMMGLLTARQYFNGAGTDETTLRNDINTLWNEVEWDWYRRDGRKVLYWNWSPDKQWAVNVPVQGWNECLITYVMAASSTTHGITKAVYDSGFARNGAMVNISTYYGYKLPLGPTLGGPLFFSHYSFMGLDPNGLKDTYADYQLQTKNHTLINYSFCVANPNSNYGYSDSCWGLTASDIKNSYTASSPTNDVSVIAPTAALSSFPYTPSESMKALKFFYYVLGDKIWKEYGFTDAFSLKQLWYADSFLAIDQGPVIVMIENHRTGLIWNLFTSCPEVKDGLRLLGFTAPYL